MSNAQPPQRLYHSRSRWGCVNCKKRRRKCDETRPGCMACAYRGVKCGGYAVQLRWGNDTPPEGQASASASGSAALTTGMPPTVVDGSSPYSAGALTPSTLSSTLSSSILPFPMENESVADKTDDELFDEFMRSGIEMLFKTNVNDRCTVTMMTRAAAESPATRAACIALQLSRYEDQKDRFFRVFEDAVRLLLDELRAAQGVIKNGTFCAGLLICPLSLTQALPWTKNLLCMANLYNLHGDLNHIAACAEDPCTHEFLEVMGVMDIPEFVLGRTTPHLRFWRRFRQAERVWKHGTPVGGVETCTGRPRALLDIIARIGDNDLADPVAIERDLWFWAGEMGENLQVHFWDATRWAAMLSLRQRRRKVASGPTDGAQDDGQGNLLPPTEVVLCRLLAALDGMRLGLQNPENSHLLIAKGVLYPYVVASSECGLLREHPDWKMTLDRVRNQELLSGPHRWLNVSVILDLIDEAWKRGDMSFDPDQASRARGVEIALF